jgi:hypothetical protein
MKNLLTNSISTSVGFPVKSGTLDFLQTASSEMLNALGRSIIGKDFSTSIPYALYGCNNTGSGSSYVIEAGAILWDGVLYLVPAVSFTLTGGNSVYVATSTTYVTSAVADPVTFTDGVARSVHADTKMSVYQSALAPSPSAGFAYSTLEYAVQPFKNISSYSATISSLNFSYKRNRDGLVVCSGDMLFTSGASATEIVFTLPVGYRPSTTILIAIVIQGALGCVQISTSGVVTINAYTGTLASKNAYLGSFSFYN